MTYIPVSQTCNAPNSLQNDPLGDLAYGASEATATAASVNAAQAAFATLLTRAPSDFADLGPAVAVDVQTVNAETGPSRQGILTGSAPAGSAGNGGPAALQRGGGGGRPVSCDLGTGACTVLPLNGPGAVTLPQPARPAVLTTTQGPLPGPPGQPGGLGAVGDPRRIRSRFGARAAAIRGIGDTGCCSQFPAWGDAFPNGGPSNSPISGLLNWIESNPWLAAGIGVAGLLMLGNSGKGTRRG